MAKQRVLTVANLEKEGKKLQKRKKISVNGYSLEIDEKFNPTKITELVADLVKNNKFAIKTNIDLNVIFLPYVFLLIVKHFTSLDVPDQLEKQLKILEILVDGDFLNPIISEIPTEDITKIMEAIGRAGEDMNKVIDGYEERLAQIKLENEEVEEVSEVGD